jgi:hypothetical protein
MAKKSDDKISSRGVGLKASEWAVLEKLANELDTTPHAIAAYGIRYFLKAYDEGRIKPQLRKTHTLPDL